MARQTLQVQRLKGALRSVGITDPVTGRTPKCRVETRQADGVKFYGCATSWIDRALTDSEVQSLTQQDQSIQAVVYDGYYPYTILRL